MTNQALPESIRRQVEEAEALEKQLYPQEAPVEGNTEPVEAVEPEPVQAEVVEPVAQPEPVADPEEETFRRRYEVLNGKYTAEVPRLYAQVREANEQLQRAFSEIEQLKTATTQKQEAPVKDNDAETFGEDLVEVVDRRAEQKAKALVAKELERVDAYIKQLEAKVGAVDQQVAVSAQDRFLQQLGKIVPDYEAVNADPKFLEYLGVVDPSFGFNRQSALDVAVQNLNSQQAAEIFLAYKQLTGKQVQTQQRQQVRQELERQVAPTSTKSSAPVNQAGRVWSVAEYEQALDPRNIASMGRAQADALYAEAEAAYNEGRVRF